MLLVTAFILALTFQDAPAEKEAPPTPTIEEFANQVVTAFSAGEADALSAFFDVERFLDRALGGVEADPPAVEGFRDGFKKSFRLGHLCAVLGNQGWAERLRIEAKDDGSWGALCRLVYPGAFIDYYVFRIEQHGGAFCVTDVSYLADCYSQSEVTLEGGEAIFTDPASPDGLQIALLFKKSKEQERAGEYEGLLQTITELEKRGHGTKRLLIQKLRVLSLLKKKDEYGALLEKIQETYPADPNLPHVLYKICLREGRLADALPHLDAIDRWAGDDPYIEYLRGILSNALKRRSDAKRFHRRAIEEDPLLLAPYYELIAYSLEEKDFETTGAMMTTLEELLESDLRAVLEDSQYEAFAASDAGKL